MNLNPEDVFYLSEQFFCNKIRPDATLQVRLGTSLRPRNRIRSSPPPNRRRFWNEIEIKIGFKDRST
jgi:hypothetical protein